MLKMATQGSLCGIFGYSFYAYKLLADYIHVLDLLLGNTFLMDLKSIVLVELKVFHGQ